MSEEVEIPPMGREFSVAEKLKSKNGYAHK